MDFPPNDPTAETTMLSPGAQPVDEGMSLSQLENILSDIRFQPRWREEANRATDYYDGNQLGQARLSRMDRLGIPPLVTNLVAPAINAVLGMEAKARTDWRVVQEDEAQPVAPEMLDALNAKLTEAERESRADRGCSDAYAAMVKSGLGWVEVARPLDPFEYPYRVQHVHRDEIFWDWRGKNMDTTDWRYLVRKRRYDIDELTAMMPEHKRLIELAVEDRFSTWQWDTRDMYTPDMARAIDQERITNIDASEWRDAERRRATLFEVWYRKWIRGVVMRLPNGRVMPYDPANIKHQAAVQVGVATLQEAAYTEVRMAIYLGPHRLYDVKSPYPYRYFPYVPFFCYREDKTGVPYGLIRAMFSPQDAVNSADARMHWMMTARRLVAHSDAIDTRVNSWSHVQQELSRPDAVILLDPNKPGAKFEVQQDFQLNAQQFERRMQAAADIENAGGIYKAMLGKEGAATSGIAINSLVEQGSTVLAEPNDNYRFSRRQVGEMLFALVKEDIGKAETPVAIGTGRRKKIVVLNQRLPDGRIGNQISATPAKVVLSDVPSTPAFRAQQLMILSDTVKSLPPQMQALAAPMIVALTDVPDRDELVAQLKKAVGIQDQTPEEEAAANEQMAQQQALQMQMAQQAMAADTAVKEAQAKKHLAEAEKIAAELNAPTGDNPEVTALQQQVQEALRQAQEVQDQMSEALREAQENATQQINHLKLQIEAQRADTSAKRFEITTNAAVERERIEAERAARVAEINATREAAQAQAKEAGEAQLAALAKQIEALAKQFEQLNSRPEPEARPEPEERQELPPINITVPVTVERASGNKTVKLVPAAGGGYTADVKETE